MPTHSPQKHPVNNVVLDIKRNSTKAHLDCLGDVVLKYVSHGNDMAFARLLEQEISDKDFVQQVLFHQLLEPTISFDEFKKISDKDLKTLGSAFQKRQDSYFKYTQNTGDFYKDFRSAIKTKHDEHVALLRKSLEPMIHGTLNKLNAFNEQYASVTQQALGGLTYVQDVIKQVSHAGEQINKMMEGIRPAIEQYQATARILTETFSPRIEFLQTWTSNNSSLFERINNYWQDVDKGYQIAEKDAYKILKRYKWFIAPNMPASFIFKVVKLGRKKGRQDKPMNQLFTDYFSADNWSNLEIHMREWEKNPIFKKRMKILKNCLKILRNSDSKTNVGSVVLPALIAQIDGFLTDYLIDKNIQFGCDYDDLIDRNTGKIRKKGRKSQFQKTNPTTLTPNLDDLANDIFLNILFQGSQKGKPLKTPFNFNRHKIMHGEKVNYGKKDYLVRCFLLIDFLVSLK
jgi:hypothetical protein